MKPCNRRCRCICFVGNMWSFHYICHVTEQQRGDKWCQLCFFWFYSALLFHETATGGNHLALLIANTLHSFGFCSPTTMEGSTFSENFHRTDATAASRAARLSFRWWWLPYSSNLTSFIVKVFNCFSPFCLLFLSLFLSATLSIFPNKSQFFKYEPVTLSCGVLKNSNWTIKRNTSTKTNEECSKHWGTKNESNCFLQDAYPSDSGLYWCDSGAGACSEAVNITVTGEFKY